MSASEKVLKPEMIVSAYSSLRHVPGEGQRKYASTGLDDRTLLVEVKSYIEERLTRRRRLWCLDSRCRSQQRRKL
jgi:hypothetical protein